MTITVGTDTYISLDDAFTYHQNHGNTTWTGYRKIISSIVTHSEGVQVTTTLSHNYSVGDRVSLYGTTLYNYAGNVISVIDSVNFTLDLTYISDESSGYCVDESLEICLRKATEWIDNHPDHKGNWLGSISVSTQLLSFPRNGLTDEENRDIEDDVIPDAVEKACCEMAYKALSEIIFPDIGATSRNVKKKKIDVIETEWFSPTTSSLRKKYDYVDNLLSGLLKNSTNLVTLTRGY